MRKALLRRVLALALGCALGGVTSASWFLRARLPPRLQEVSALLLAPVTLADALAARAGLGQVTGAVYRMLAVQCASYALLVWLLLSVWHRLTARRA